VANTFSIIIVTWNALDHLKTFLPSVAKSNYEQLEIIIADNASTDETVNWVNNSYPQCKVVTFDDNHGYCGGNNRAVKYSVGDILVFLNNDVSVAPDWLTHLDKAFENPATTIVQPKLKSFVNPDEFEYAGAAGGMIDYMGYPFCKGRLFDNVEKDLHQYNESTPIFWASGAAFAIRKEAFQELGGFDEDFEFHMEEIDICWRAWKIGYTVKSCPESEVFHLGGGSMPMGSSRKVYYNYRNSLMMLTKNSTSGNLFFKIFGRLLLDGAAGVRSLLTGDPKAAWAIIRSHFAYYRRLPAMMKKRKIIRSSSTQEVPDGLIYPKLIIVQYFFKGIKKYSDLK